MSCAAYPIESFNASTQPLYTAMFRQKAKLLRVVCLQEPCTWDSKLGIDPNRKDGGTGNPNIVMVEISPEELRSMSDDEKSRLVIATNGILNETQRAGELALQNAPTNEKPYRNDTGESKPGVVLVASPYSGNPLSDLLVAGYEKFLAPVLGYTNPDMALAEAVREVSTGRDASGDPDETLKAATMLGHSRGTIVERNALEILKDQGYTNNQLTVLAKGPAVSEQELLMAAEKINENINSKQLKSDEMVGIFDYASFPNDPVATFVGNSPNGQWLSSLREIGSMFSTPTSAHSSYGTGAPGCTTVEIPYDYDKQDPAILQQRRQQRVNDLLKQGPIVPNQNLPGIDQAKEQMTMLRRQVGIPIPSLMQRFLSWQPPDAIPPADPRVEKLDQLGQALGNGEN